MPEHIIGQIESKQQRSFTPGASFRVAASQILAFLLAVPITTSGMAAETLEFVRPSTDGQGFVGLESGRRIQLWGVNYDHDGKGRLIEDYWHDEWPRVSEDFGEIKALGANSIRIHLQLGRFLNSADKPMAENLARLAKLVRLAEKNGLYLVITGLGCYRQRDVPVWYDRLPEHERWQAQATFWKAVAGVCKDSPAVFSYDLMNEPILPGEKPETEWLAKPLGDKHFVQRISLDRAGRSRAQIAKAWVQTLADAIRRVDPRHMITVGVIPWAYYFPGAKPLFYSQEVGGPLDYVSVHFYPKAGKIDKALDALRVYELRKPLVVEEIFPLECSAEELLEFMDRSKPYVDGWVSFYWGETIEECQARGDLAGAISATWFEKFKAHAPR